MQNLGRIVTDFFFVHYSMIQTFCEQSFKLKSLVESMTGHPQGLDSDPVLRNYRYV